MDQSSIARYAVCVSNSGFPASLEPRKLYPVIADAEAEADGLTRVVDESGEDYLYPAELFAPVELAPEVARALAATG